MWASYLSLDIQACSFRIQQARQRWEFQEREEEDKRRGEKLNISRDEGEGRKEVLKGKARPVMTINKECRKWKGAKRVVSYFSPLRRGLKVWLPLPLLCPFDGIPDLSLYQNNYFLCVALWTVVSHSHAASFLRLCPEIRTQTKLKDQRNRHGRMGYKVRSLLHNTD